MVFSTLVFLYAFFPICLILHIAARSTKMKNYALLVMSLLFYAWGEPVWVFLMVITACVNWFFALMVEAARDKRSAKLAMIIAVAVDLLLLGVFKYSGFFVENINMALHLAIPVPQISLPIGISFYTFQILSYIVDVYRGDTKAQKSPANFMLYVSLFPQLIAGPIVRYTDIERQLESRTVTPEGFSRGITKFLIGLAKKVLLANFAGKVAATLLGGDMAQMSVLEGWLGMLLYAFQIYFDFSGYSDMAIGLGRMFGFSYPENFNYPYIATSITDFWRRWHISLSSFFRDYVYIPMGGNRKHQIWNMLVVWFLTGMWHGASWNFILWGLYFFVWLVLEKFVLRRVLEKVPKLLKWFFTFVLVLVSWVFFYYTDLSQCFGMLKLMFGFAGRPFADPKSMLLLANNGLFLGLCAVCCLPVASWFRKATDRMVVKNRGRGRQIAFALCLLFNTFLLVLCTAAMVGSTFNPFLYFKF